MEVSISVITFGKGDSQSDSNEGNILMSYIVNGSGGKIVNRELDSFTCSMLDEDAKIYYPEDRKIYRFLDIHDAFKEIHESNALIEIEPNNMKGTIVRMGSKALGNGCMVNQFYLWDETRKIGQRDILYLLREFCNKNPNYQLVINNCQTFTNYIHSKLKQHGVNKNSLI